MEPLIRYPIESVFVPSHLVIIVVIVIIFIITTYFITRNIKTQEYPITNSKSKSKEAVPSTNSSSKLKGDSGWLKNIISIVGPILGLFAATFPYITAPVIDYTVCNEDPTGGVHSSTIYISNFGSGTAKNILISLFAKDLNFIKVTSVPLLDTRDINTTNNNMGHIGFKMDLLPPRSQTTIIVTWKNNSNIDSNTKIITYLRSEQITGFHDTILAGIAYGVSLSLMVFITIIYTIRPEYKKKWWFKTIIIGAILSVILIMVFLNQQVSNTTNLDCMTIKGWQSLFG